MPAHCSDKDGDDEYPALVMSDDSDVEEEEGRDYGDNMESEGPSDHANKGPIRKQGASVFMKGFEPFFGDLQDAIFASDSDANADWPCACTASTAGATAATALFKCKECVNTGVLCAPISTTHFIALANGMGSSLRQQLCLMRATGSI
ncbi:hypothetical protein EST38_g2659 [Candolleomyces aberdarensis]|uniref:Uncharacterized protein n=1 Tax=Candolleomyces aberdarensis TaxID=2316362 RepID=A0A4Q2DSC4_9AGAR|nr:hypothetical protein EST38_g2659 [Candolleomyces aberdarensis]